MTIGNDDEFERLKIVGGLVARTMRAEGGHPTVQYEHTVTLAG